MRGIDPVSLLALFVRTSANGVPLSNATAFLWLHDNKMYLVTNWHVLSGRDPRTGQPSDSGHGIPDVIRVAHHDEQRLGRFVECDHKLVDDEGNSLWRMHPRGQDVDIAVLQLGLPPGARGFHVNGMPQQERMPLQVTSDIFIIGFPFGIQTAGRFPIWKRASVASEPEIGVAGAPYFFADTATRSGMSGSPVLLFSRGAFADENGTMVATASPNLRFVGVYSGRIVARDAIEAQLGLVWHLRAMLEVIEGGIPGDYALRPEAAL